MPDIDYSLVFNRKEITRMMRKHHADKEHVDIDDRALLWWGAYHDGELIGCCGARFVGKSTIRMKGLFVVKEYRGQGIGSKLVDWATTGAVFIFMPTAVTAFATDMSKPIFEKWGLPLDHTNKNGIHFMKKELTYDEEHHLL